MSMLWIGVLIAAGASFVQKWLGYQVPPALLERPTISRITTLLPVALISRYRQQRDWLTLLRQGGALIAAALLLS